MRDRTSGMDTAPRIPHPASRIPYRASRRREAGFTFLVMLVAVIVIGVGLAATGEVWSHSRQREKELELLFIGNQFRQAIELYYQRTRDQRTCPVKCYPEKLEDLLQDKRDPGVQRYLRKLYADPMTGKAQWGLVKAPGGGIMGVHSLSNAEPIKRAGFRSRDQSLTGATTYYEWRFIYEPSQGKPPVVVSPIPQAGSGLQSPLQPLAPPQPFGPAPQQLTPAPRTPLARPR